MNQSMVDKIVQAVLYEGYNLYPYRPSVKNRCRWTFGGLYPRSYSEALEGTDPWNLQVQCLVQGEQDATLEVKFKFLHLVQRTIGVLPSPCDELPEGEVPAYKAVDSFLLNGTRHQTWQEAVEREVTIGPLPLATILSRPEMQFFTFPAGHTVEPFRGPDRRIATIAVRDQEAVEGSAEVSAETLDEPVLRLTVRVANRTPLENARACSRDEALMRTLVAMHALVMAREGKLFSLADPPEALRKAAATCQNRGVWPMLVGAPGEQDAMLASPIILYDYPRIAAESPGDLFDGTEIDEILTLRIMTLTEEEKTLAGGTDDRTRRLLERTESLAREQLAGLHGAVRAGAPGGLSASAGATGGLSASAESAAGSGWQATCDTPQCQSGNAEPARSDGDPFAARPVIESIRVDGVELRPGDRVRLRPGLGGDILDLALSGKTATIESIEQDFEDRFHVAVTLDEDPGRDLGRARQPGHRFFFKPEEVAPLDDAEARA